VTIPLVYVAHPVGAPTPGAVAINLGNAAEWVSWLKAREPGVAFAIPWLGPLLAGIEDDGDPASRARGLRDSVEAARRCDGIVLCGGVLSFGMQLELDAVLEAGGWVADLRRLGRLVPRPDHPLPSLAEGRPGLVNAWSNSPLAWGREAWRSAA